MKPMRSLRSRIVAGMVVLIGLVFGIARARRDLDPLAGRVGQPGARPLCWKSTDLGNGLVSAVVVRGPLGGAVSGAPPAAISASRCWRRATPPMPCSAPTAGSPPSPPPTATSSTRSPTTRPRWKSPMPWRTAHRHGTARRSAALRRAGAGPRIRCWATCGRSLWRRPPARCRARATWGGRPTSAADAVAPVPGLVRIGFWTCSGPCGWSTGRSAS